MKMKHVLVQRYRRVSISKWITRDVQIHVDQRQPGIDPYCQYKRTRNRSIIVRTTERFVLLWLANCCGCRVEVVESLAIQHHNPPTVIIHSFDCHCEMIDYHRRGTGRLWLLIVIINAQCFPEERKDRVLNPGDKVPLPNVDYWSRMISGSSGQSNDSGSLSLSLRFHFSPRTSPM